MSLNIQGKSYQNSKFEQISKMLASKPDDVPFLLFPIRLETRFMSEDRPVSSSVDGFYKALPNLLKLDYALRELAAVKAPVFSEVLKTLKAFSNDVSIVIKDIRKLHTLSSREYKLLRRHMLYLKKSIFKIKQHFPKSKTSNRLPIGKVEDLNTFLNNMLYALNAAVKTIKNKGEEDFVEITEINKLLDDWQAHIHSIQTEKIINKTKKKKVYYTRIETLFSSLDQLKPKIEKAFSQDIYANSVYLDNLKNKIQQIEIKSQSLFAKLKGVGSTYKRTQYLERLEKEIMPFFEDIKSMIFVQAIPKINFFNALRNVDVKELIYEVCLIQQQIHSLNRLNINSFNQVRIARSTILRLFRKIREKGHYIIKGNEGEIAFLREKWSLIDAELEKITSKIQKVKATRSIEKTWITRTLNFIHNDIRKDLSGLRKEIPITEPFIKNKSLQESAEAFLLAFDGIVELKKYFAMLLQATKVKEPTLRNLFDTLEQYNDSLKVYVRKIYILPEQYYRNFKQELDIISGYFEQIKAFAGENKLDVPLDMRTLLIAIQEQVNTLHFLFSKLENDILDAKDPLYTDFKDKFVYSLKTYISEELWIRIFPDDIAISYHEEALTKGEIDDAKDYWIEYWNAGGDKDLEKGAWNMLAAIYGAPRAAFLRRKLNPNQVPQAEKQPIKNIVEVNRELKALSLLITSFSSPSTGLKKRKQQIAKFYKKANQLRDFLWDVKKVDAFLFNKLIETSQNLYDQLPNLELDVLSMEDLESEWNESVRRGKELILNFLQKLNESIAKMEPLPHDSLELRNTVPMFPTDIPLRKEMWTGGPQTTLMPDRFVAVLKNNADYKYMATGEKIPEVLKVGINPMQSEKIPFEYDEQGNLVVDEEIKWMVDFETAVENGMGIVVPITKEDAINGFSKLMVLGVNSSTGAESGKCLYELFQSHYFSPDGMELLPIGTPTNNTTDAKSAYLGEADEERYYELETKGNDLRLEHLEIKKTDGQRLADALGLPYSFVNHLNYADQHSISNALLMNEALWRPTMGNFMEEIMDTVFTADNIKRTRNFFTSYVSGRGFLPAIRIGSQPYGIMPTTAFSKFKVFEDETLPTISPYQFKNPHTPSAQSTFGKRFEIRLKNLLYMLNEEFQSIVKTNHLSISEGNRTNKSPQAHFMELLGLQPTSVENYSRYGVNVANRRREDPFSGITVNFRKEQAFGFQNLTAKFGDFIKNGSYIDKDFYGTDSTYRMKKSKVFRMRNFDVANPLKGDVVQSHESESQYLHKENGHSFITKLFATHPSQYAHVLNSEEENRVDPLFADYLEQEKPYSLFFLLFRQTLLLAYRDTALDILEKEGIINENTRRRAGGAETFNFYFYNEELPTNKKPTEIKPGIDVNCLNDETVFSKWNYLFDDWGGITKLFRSSPFTSFPLSYDSNFLNNPFIKFLEKNEISLADYIFEGFDTNVPELFKHEHKNMLGGLEILKDTYLRLAELPINQLERHFAEVMDLCSYRLDAWQLGIANKRLQELQKPGNNNSVFLGSYGWLENLKKGKKRTEALDIPESLYKKGDGAICRDQDNQGFIHTPSINHAVTVAILRAGYLANLDNPDYAENMAINLSSQRVRKALKLFDQVQKGLDIGVVLGYQMERGLHEAFVESGQELDRYIYDLRTQFPAYTLLDKDASNEDAMEQNLPAQVINGMLLLESVRAILAGRNYKNLLKGMFSIQYEICEAIGIDPNTPKSIIASIFREIDHLANSLDAMGDLVFSESIYQMVQGNHVRSAALFSAIAEGRTPPEVQITATPRTGNVLTQRAILQLTPVALGSSKHFAEIGSGKTILLDAKPIHWKDILFTVRAFAEPTLNKFFGEQIGDPNLIRCLFTFEEEGLPTTDFIRLADLNLQAIDVVYLMNSSDENMGAEMDARIAYFVREKHALAKDVELKLDYQTRSDLLLGDEETMIPEIKTFQEIMPVLNSLFKISSNCRPTTAEDYYVPGNDDLPQADQQQLDELDLFYRHEDLLNKLNRLIQETKNYFNQLGIDFTNPMEVKAAEYSFAAIEFARNQLAYMAEFGLGNSFPNNVVESDEKTAKELYNQLAASLNLLQEQYAKAQIDLTAYHKMGNEMKIETLTEAMQQVLGKAFRLICPFKFKNLNELKTQIELPKQQGILRNMKSFEMDQWQHGVAKVRENMNTIDMLSVLAQTFDVDFPEPRPIQLPLEYPENESGEAICDYWLGAEFPADYEPESDKLSLVVYQPELVNQGGSNDIRTGLLIDEWIEIIPNKEETSGIAFNYDQPDTEPPQTLLLAISPELKGNWKWENLLYTIEDTLDLTKIRLMEPEHLDQSMFSQVLPAIYGEAVPVSKRIPNLKVEGVVQLQFSENNETPNK